MKLTPNLPRPARRALIFKTGLANTNFELDGRSYSSEMAGEGREAPVESLHPIPRLHPPLTPTSSSRTVLDVRERIFAAITSLDALGGQAVRAKRSESAKLDTAAATLCDDNPPSGP